MILDGISRYGGHFQGIDAIFKLLSLSVAKISAREETLVAPFLLSTTQRSVCKNDKISDALPTDISATERLSITKYYQLRDYTNAFKMSPIT